MLLGLIFLILFSLLSRAPRRGHEDKVSYSDFLDQVDAGTVTEVAIEGSWIYYQTVHDLHLKTYAPVDPALVKTLRDKHIKITAEQEEQDPLWLLLLVQTLPLASVLAVWIWYLEKRIIRQ